jgi:hypothetical protein
VGRLAFFVYWKTLSKRKEGENKMSTVKINTNPVVRTPVIVCNGTVLSRKELELIYPVALANLAR